MWNVHTTTGAHYILFYSDGVKSASISQCSHIWYPMRSKFHHHLVTNWRNAKISLTTLPIQPFYLVSTRMAYSFPAHWRPILYHYRGSICNSHDIVSMCFGVMTLVQCRLDCYSYYIIMMSSACRDMVKRLINKMDFEALEVKLKKCKVRYIWQEACY